MPTDSGIRAVEDVLLKYNRVFKNQSTAGSASNKLPYAVFKFNHEELSKSKEDPDKIIVDYDEKYYDKQHTYSELLNLLPNDSVRYVCFDFPFISKEGMKSSAVFLINWSPPNGSVKQKFKLTSSADGLKKKLGVQDNRKLGGERDDVDEAAIFSKNKDWKPCPPEMLDLSQEPLDFKPEGTEWC